MSEAKNLFYFFSGAKYSVLRICSYRTRVKHTCLSLSLIFAVLVSFFAGVEIAAQFTSRKVILVGTGLFWSSMVLIFDLILINSGLGNGFTKWLRILVGLCNSLISLTSLLVLLNQSTIDGYIILDKGSKLKNIDNNYLAQKEGRYAQVLKQKDEAEIYNSNVVKPEAANGYPGPKYLEKKAAYDEMIRAIDKEKAKLDSNEIQYYNAYQSERIANSSVESNDFFIKASYIPKIIMRKGWVMILLTLSAGIVIAYVELQTVALKISMKKETEYSEKESQLEQMKCTYKNDFGKKIMLLENKKQEFFHTKAFSDIMHQENEQVNRIVENAIVHIAGEEKLIQGLKTKGYDELAKIKEVCRDRFLKNVYDICKGTSFSNISSISEGVIPEQNINTILLFTKNMGVVLAKIEAQFVYSEIPLAIFNWIVKHITYQVNHGGFFYRTSREVWNDGNAICGEMAVLYMTFLRKKEVTVNFVEVTKDCFGNNVSHACVQITHLGETFLSDPAYQMFKVEHQSFNIWSDEKLEKHYKKWNENTY